MPSPTGSLRPSPGSSAGSLRRSNEQRLASSSGVTIDALVNHLLAAKRALSSMNLVLQANELANSARNVHQESTILAAHTTFLRNSTLDQAAILVKVRRSLQATYDWGSKDFKVLVRAMDDADSQLERTMEMLRGTIVQSGLRPKGEEQKNLLDFVEEDSVEGLREAMKKNIQELQAIQQSFDGDLLRFDTDIRDLKKAIIDSALPQTTDDANTHGSMAAIVMGMIDNSSAMAQLLSSLTKHFDMCVTAIRTTEGAAALARRRAAEVTQSQGGDGVSISGVIAEQESNMSDLEPNTEKDRAEMLRVVVQDAEEVNDVVREIQERLLAMENDYKLLEESTSRTEIAYQSVLEGYTILSGVSDRLGVYLAAGDDFTSRWDIEKESIFTKLEDMKGMRGFYEGYASAYSSLLLEVERRRAVDERVKAIWRTAQESVDKLLSADRTSREGFRQDVGEYLPTDLWPGMHLAPRRWQVSRAKSEKLDDATWSQNEERLPQGGEARNTDS